MMTNVQQTIADRLRLVPSYRRLVIKPTDGKETISEAREVFGDIDRDFLGCDVESKPTAEMPARVYEMTRNGRFGYFFCGFRRKLDDLCFTQPQIKCFVADYSDMLHPSGHKTWFLFKSKGELLVARVTWLTSGQKTIKVNRLLSEVVWPCANYRSRLVVPELSKLVLSS